MSNGYPSAVQRGCFGYALILFAAVLLVLMAAVLIIGHALDLDGPATQTPKVETTP